MNVKTISGIVKKVQSGIHAFPDCTEFRYFLKFASLFFNQEQNLPESRICRLQKAFFKHALDCGNAFDTDSDTTGIYLCRSSLICVVEISGVLGR